MMRTAEVVPNVLEEIGLELKVGLLLLPVFLQRRAVVPHDLHVMIGPSYRS